MALTQNSFQQMKRLPPIDHSREFHFCCFALIGRCKKAEEIGEELFIGVNTVNSHKKRIKELLDTNDTWELIRYGLAFDLV